MLLDRLKVERVPAAVRRPSEMLGGRSMFDIARQQHFADLRDAVRSMFDVARVQP